MLLLFSRAIVLRTSRFCKADCLHTALFFVSPLRRTRSFSRDAHLCYVIYLGYPRHEGMRTLRSVGALAAPGGRVPLLFTLANFVPREATCRVYRTTHNFALSRLTNAPAYPKLRHSAKVCVAKRERDRERENGNDTRGCIDTLRWERLIEIAAGIARTVAEKNQSIRN